VTGGAWYVPLAAYAWQVAVHSAVAGFIFYAWVHRVPMSSGRTKRRLLATLLVLPLLTAAIPGRGTIEFAERIAWLNSARVLAVPLPLGFQMVHLAIVIGLLMIGFTVWQELVPALRHPVADVGNAPEALVRQVRALSGWERCVVAVSPLSSVMLATSGMPGHVKVTVSRGALASLTTPELAAVMAHEHAHWQAGRWWWSHGLFVVRLLQCYNPVALWVFREHCIESEIECDAAAVAGRDPHVLARVLLRIYNATDRRDVSARAALRKRVDVILAGGPQDAPLPELTVTIASAVMLVVLPWIV
jgi:hypothetical protein